MPKLKIDRDRCQGHGQCVMAAPELFELDDDGLSVALRSELAEEELRAARTAELVCPVSAIRVIP